MKMEINYVLGVIGMGSVKPGDPNKRLCSELVANALKTQGSIMLDVPTARQ